MTDRGEGEVEADHRHLLGGRHVVEFVTGLLREVAVDIEGDMPIRIAQEQLGNVGDVGLDQDFDVPDCSANDVWPGVWPGVEIEVMPGATSLPHSYLVTLDSMPAKVFFTLAK